MDSRQSPVNSPDIAQQVSLLLSSRFAKRSDREMTKSRGNYSAPVQLKKFLSLKARTGSLQARVNNATSDSPNQKERIDSLDLKIQES